MGFDVLRKELVTALQVDDYGRAKKAITHMQILQAAEKGHSDTANRLVNGLEPNVCTGRELKEKYDYPGGLTDMSLDAIEKAFDTVGLTLGKDKPEFRIKLQKVLEYFLVSGKDTGVDTSRVPLTGERYKFPDGLAKVLGVAEGALISLPNPDYVMVVGEHFWLQSLSTTEALCVVKLVLEKVSPTTRLVLYQYAD